MRITPLKTSRVEVGDSLQKLLDDYIPSLEEKTILAVTSKIISLCERSAIPKNEVPSKVELIRNQADAFLEEDEFNPHGFHLTIKNNLLLPSAGIDESNGGEVYILYPQDIQASAAAIWQHLRQRDKLQELGVLITDSHTSPLRAGVTGISLGWCGFYPLYNYSGQPDLFGRILRVTKINHLDALAAAAVFVMGEGTEQTPCAIIEDAPKIVFQDRPPTEEEISAVTIPFEEDLYRPLLQSAKWKWKKKDENNTF